MSAVLVVMGCLCLFTSGLVAGYVVGEAGLPRWLVKRYGEPPFINLGRDSDLVISEDAVNEFARRLRTGLR